MKKLNSLEIIKFRRKKNLSKIAGWENSVSIARTGFWPSNNKLSTASEAETKELPGVRAELPDVRAEPPDVRAEPPPDSRAEPPIVRE